MSQYALCITKHTFLLLFFCIAAKAQSDKVLPDTTGLNNLKFTVEDAPEWSGLFKRQSGWFGADGIYTIPLNGKANKRASANEDVLFVFSDTMVGDIRDSALVPGYEMIHNSTAVLRGNQPDERKIRFHWPSSDKQKPLSVFEPKTPNSGSKDYYWLGAGFVNQKLKNTVYLFGYRVYNFSEEAFGFREIGNTLIKFLAKKSVAIRQYQQMDTPFYFTDEQGDVGSYGAGIYVNTKESGAKNPDGYLYIYGVSGKAKNLLAARVLPQDFENYTKWRFWDGKTWNSDMNKATTITSTVSNELSVSELPDGRYALVSQLGGISKYVALRIGRTPYGPFGEPIKIWDCSKDLIRSTFLSYNAKAHPVISKPNELLISYNINSFEFIKDLEKYPNLYRPRFIRIKFQ